MPEKSGPEKSGPEKSGPERSGPERSGGSEAATAEVVGLIEQARGRWMTGAAAAGVAGPAWRSLLEGASGLEAELRLAAVVGQALEVALRPAPPEGLFTRPNLPAPSLPLLEEACRPRFRRLLEGAAKEAEARGALLAFLEARGRMAHPADWTPRAEDETAPALYAPWRAWAEDATTATQPFAAMGLDAPLTQENWSEFGPGERRMRLKEMRRADPAAARDLIAACAGAEPAERRLKIIEILGEGLGEEDASYLEGLAKDRAPKIRALAAGLLARLGRRNDVAEEAAELAAFLDYKSAGVLRAAKLSAPPLKNDAQRRRRTELFEALPLHALAAALSISSEEAMASWNLEGDFRATLAFGKMVERSAPDALLPAFAMRLASGDEGDAGILELLAPRLSDAAREAAVLRLLSVSRGGLGRLALMAGAALGRVDASTIMAAPSTQDLKARLKAMDGDAYRARDAEPELFQLGLLAAPEAAAALLEMAIAQGLISVDPRLDMLHLNIALGASPAAPEGRTP